MAQTEQEQRQAEGQEDRPKDKGGKVADYLAARGFFRTAPFPVTRFVLFSSRASTGGGPYVVEEEYPLIGA